MARQLIEGGTAPYCPLWLVRIFPFLAWIGTVDRTTLRADLVAGLTGAVIVLPQGVAFALIAGLPAEYGLYTAIVTPVVAALFGSSRHLISGPTTAISLVVFATISPLAEPGTPEFIELALTLTFLAGAYQFGLGLARMGALVNFVSHTVVVGFTAGAAILIATSQMKHVLGVEIPRGESFIHVWIDLATQLAQTNGYALGIALFTLLSAVAVRKWLPRLPFMLVAMVAASLLALAMGARDQGVALVGRLPAQLPPLSLPHFSLQTIRELASVAFAVALLGLIEAVSIARAVATRSGQRINGNQEFIGQGLSNIVGSLLSSYAGSGSFTRSGINYQAGARTPLAAIFAAAILAVILLVAAPLAAYLPIPAMGGIILLVAYHLIDWRQIRDIVLSGPQEGVILGVTFFATLFLELEFAIYAGVFLSLFFYLRRTSRPQVLTVAPNPLDRKRRLTSIARRPLPQCPQIRILRIDGSLFFGAVNHVGEILQSAREQSGGANWLLIIADGINFIDLAGAELLGREARLWRQRDGGLYLVGLKRGVLAELLRSRQLRQIGVSHLFTHKSEAIARLVPHLDDAACAACRKRIFRECAERPLSGD